MGRRLVAAPGIAAEIVLEKVREVFFGVETASAVTEGRRDQVVDLAGGDQFRNVLAGDLGVEGWQRAGERPPDGQGRGGAQVLRSRRRILGRMVYAAYSRLSNRDIGTMQLESTAECGGLTLDGTEAL